MGSAGLHPADQTLARSTCCLSRHADLGTKIVLLRNAACNAGGVDLFQGLGNFASLLRQAQQMGGRMKELNEKLQSQRATGSAGAGMVTAEVNGLGELLKITIEPKLVDSGDREMIEDLIPSAVNQALAKSKQLHAEAMKSLTSDLNVPGLSEALSQMTGTSDDKTD